MQLELEDKQEKSIQDYVAIIKRRKKIILNTALVVTFIGILLIIFLPATYRSTAVILIESQDIPPDLIRSTVTSYAVQRIEEIRQRIMTTSNIMSIVQRFELYDEKELKWKTRAEISKEFRDNVEVEPISADVIDPRSGTPTQAVIAFKLSYDGDESQKVFKVTNELITLYLNENLRGRTEQSNSTSDFLSDELSSMDDLLKELEHKLSTFKEDNQGSLPELNSYNLNIIDRGQEDLINSGTRIQELESRKIQLESQLAQLSPSAPVILADGKAVLSDVDRLKSLQSEYRRKSAIYNGDHPDLVRINREMDALLQGSKTSVDVKSLNIELQTAQNQLSAIKEKYVETHPDIVKLKKQIASIENKLLTVTIEPTSSVADNPSYVLLETQLNAIESEIASLKEKQIETQKKISHHEALLLKAPAVERDYQMLLREYESLRLKHREISEKQLHAELGKNLEQERKGERFTLIQPPEVPEEPVSVNKFILLAISLILSMAMGMVFGFIAEALDPLVYGEKDIEAITGISAMAIVPYFTPNVIRPINKFRYIQILGVCALMMLIGLVAFNYLVKPLDVTWYLLLHKLEIY